MMNRIVTKIFPPQKRTIYYRGKRYFLAFPETFFAFDTVLHRLYFGAKKGKYLYFPNLPNTFINLRVCLGCDGNDCRNIIDAIQSFWSSQFIFVSAVHTTTKHIFHGEKSLKIWSKTDKFEWHKICQVDDFKLDPDSYYFRYKGKCYMVEYSRSNNFLLPDRIIIKIPLWANHPYLFYPPLEVKGPVFKYKKGQKITRVSHCF